MLLLAKELYEDGGATPGISIRIMMILLDRAWAGTASCVSV